MSETFRQTTLNLLQALPVRKLDALKQLFWSELNYNRANLQLSTRDWAQSLVEKLADAPLLFATAGDGDGFQVIYCRLKTARLQLGVERLVIASLLLEHPYSLFLFSDKTGTHWHFVNVKYERAGGQRARRVFRRITVGPEERLRTAAERIALLDTATLSPDMFGISPLIIQQRHDEAFNVEAVTAKFFEEYQKIFESFKQYLSTQSQDESWSHEYALQFLNRLMFLYYVQRKRWLGQDPDFLANYYQAYRDTDQPSDTFVSEWLHVLFFEAFNNQFVAGRSDRQHLPTKLRDTLAMAPYLNGGLFSKNKLDGRYTVMISDLQFRAIFNFLENYNFTISEDTPLDQEVAVDPEMIGKVYESLVNVSDETDERGDAGIFYTPRVEIDLMCRLTLVNFLVNHLGPQHKTLLFRLVFAFDDVDKQQADAAAAENNLWIMLDELLRTVTVLDPACGSGSFLVGMLYVLNDLRERAAAQLGRQETAYERKKDIIRNSLYGVDVMRWAVHVAELRLWLQLVIDTDMEPAELKFRPLLPNLSFKLRQGDSLVQEVGGVNLSVNRRGNIPTALKGKLTALKGEKLKFYNNEPDRKYQTQEDLQKDELGLFRDILADRVQRLEGRLKELESILRPQTNLFGEVTAPQLTLSQATARQEEEVVRADLDTARRARTALVNPRDVPFVWDIAFVEVFEDEHGGFDIVIGNPPYVRQEKIRDPFLPIEKANEPEAKKIYKAKLARSVYACWPHSFGYKPDKDVARWKLDAKSDLYIYFYMHGLHLLNGKGAFCFITSNSWLDVGYGKDLQEFLLTRGLVNFIIDNQSRRSFASADVNTVIVLLGPAIDSKTERQSSLENIARFVMLTIPFEQTLSPIIWEELESASTRTKTPEYRLQLLTQKELYASGLDEKKAYTGNKWGGRYLRAPEIFFTLMAKGKKFEDVLSSYFTGERYLNTGGADGFFIVTNVDRWGKGLSIVKNSGNPSFEGELESEFLVPLIKDYTKNNRKITIDGYDAYCIVIKDKPTPRLKEYIQWGEQQGYHQRSVTRNQHPWYKPTNQMLTAATILVPRSFNDTFVIHHNPQKFLSLRFYRLHLKKGDEKAILGYLNSTLMALILETLGNKSLGQGVLDFFMADFLSLKLPVIATHEVAKAYDAISNRVIGNIWSECGMSSSDYSLNNPKSDRLQLDQVIFDALGLTQTERDGVYEELGRMVSARLSKASSLKELSQLEW